MRIDLLHVQLDLALQGAGIDAEDARRLSHNLSSSAASCVLVANMRNLSLHDAFSGGPKLTPHV